MGGHKKEGSESPLANQKCISKKIKFREEEPFEMSGLMSKLPVEIFFEILSRVPIKSLAQCRWVSKAWYNTVRDPRFIQMHHNKVILNKPICVISYDSFEKVYSMVNHEDLEAFKTDTVYYTPKLPPERPFSGMVSCNGLIFSRNGEDPYFICNPITGEYVVLPKPPVSAMDDVVTGFVFDHVSEVFKVVRIVEDSEELNAEVYNFCTGEWRLISNVPYRFDGTKASVFFNGSLHWIGYSMDSDDESIISFNLDTEEFQQVPLPLRQSSLYRRIKWLTPKFDQYLLVLGECLSIVRTIRSEHIEIWSMKEYGLQSSWVEKYTIFDLVCLGDLEKGPYRPLQLMKNGMILMLCEHHDLGYYDPFEGSLDCIYTGAGSYLDSVLQPITHIGSLISPKSVGKLLVSSTITQPEQLESEDHEVVEEDNIVVDDDDDSDGYDLDSVTESDDDSDDYLNYDGYTSNEYEEDITKTVSKKEEKYEQEVSSMSGLISKLPTETLFDILSRLPIKSLTQCRWVCKAWFNAIKHPCFIQMHHTKVIQNKSLCVISYDSFMNEYSLVNYENLEAFETDTVFYAPRLPRGRPLHKMESCNGLILSRNGQQPYIICNPITGELMALPKPPMFAIRETVTGFGFGSISGVYKVIRVMEDKKENTSDRETKAEVYNFGTGKWRLIPKVPYHFDGTKSSVYVNGALHWIGSCLASDDEAIISFKIDTEEFEQVPLPIPPTPPSSRVLSLMWSSPRFNQYLLVLGECLCIVRTFRNEHIEIWVMKEYGRQSSWVKEYVIEDIRVDGDLEKGPYKPLQLMKNGNLLMLCENHDLGYYDPWENYLDCIYTGTGIYADSVLHSLLHAGSLISLKSVGKLLQRKRRNERK